MAILAAVYLVIMSSCKDDDEIVEYDPTPYSLSFGAFPPPQIPVDNQPTVAGVELGRRLFYEKRLSGDNTQACASCHQQKDMFSDIRQFSIGVDQLPGKRQAMAIFNMAWHTNGMFWDGRSPSLRDQALRPIQDPLEMHETLENAVAKLQQDQDYRDQFIRAFGDEQISASRIGLAIEQFEFTLISNHSKYDAYLQGNATLTPEEERGRQLFFAEYDPFLNQKGGECFHCHGGFNFTNDMYMNNGLDSDNTFTDLGRFMVTQETSDKAKFKVPSLRNVALTAPYMHDGRFASLEEVIDHYNTLVKPSSTTDELLFHSMEPGGLQLTVQEKADLIAFLKTLTDTTLASDERFSDPF
jgi:cytochrome c peroxidase